MFEPDKHQGKCDHCGTEVPQDAVVCTGCGARWGSSTGRTRQQVYDQGKATLRTGFVFGVVLLIFFLWTVYVESPWAILSMVLGFLGGPVCVGLIFGGFRQMWKAKTNLSIQWWRNG
ncbi:zinc ribbon domain-containing protein [Sessilibacter corallicola]|uniref:zinc ribbon domain-containing protein n=1 Tax=Sessilibacter corallicola TaxID=2904075 RepID=UPI00333F7A4E